MWLYHMSSLRCAPLLQCIGRLKPSAFRSMVKWVSAFGLSNNNKWRWWVWLSGSLQADSQPGSFGLVWGLAAAWRHAIFITWTGWTLTVALSYDDSTINIVVGIIIIIIIIIIMSRQCSQQSSQFLSSKHNFPWDLMCEISMTVPCK